MDDVQLSSKFMFNDEDHDSSTYSSVKDMKLISIKVKNVMVCCFLVFSSMFLDIIFCHMIYKGLYLKSGKCMLK
jgi:hypothetical protein